MVVRLAWRWSIGREPLHAPPLPPIGLKTRGFVLNHRIPTEPEVAEVLGQLQGKTGSRAIPLTLGLRSLLEARARNSPKPLLRVKQHQVRAVLQVACQDLEIPVELMLAVCRSASVEDKARGVRQAGLGQRLSKRESRGQPLTGSQLGAQTA